MPKAIYNRRKFPSSKYIDIMKSALKALSLCQKLYVIVVSFPVQNVVSFPVQTALGVQLGFRTQ